MFNHEKEIRENWFSEHIAEYKTYDDIKVLRWAKPNSWMYGCNYVFQGCNLYISGDIGEAVFCFTEKADVKRIAQYSLSYFKSKLRAFCEPEEDFNSDKAIKRLREWLKELKEYDKTYDHDQMKDFFAEIREECISKSGFISILHKYDDLIGDLDVDYWEWMPNCGDETPIRLEGYLIGLQMASEQLTSEPN